MTNSIYDDIFTLEKDHASNKEVRQALIDLGIFGIFSYAYDKYHEEGVFRNVVHFINHAYSYESKKVIIGMDWKKCKLNIAASVHLPNHHYKDIIDFHDVDMAYTMKCYMNLYKDNSDYTQLMLTKDMHQRVVEMGTDFKVDEEGNCELDKNVKNLKYADDLLEKIHRMEKKIKERYRNLTKPEEELSTVLPSNFRVESLKVEHSSFIQK